MEYVKSKIGTFVPFMGLIIVTLFFLVSSQGHLVSGDNVEIIINQAFTTVMLATGLSLIYAQGAIDFSTGAVLAISNLVAILIIAKTGMEFLALPVCIIVSVLCYFINGYITIKLKLNPYIGSVAMQFLCRGIVNSVMESSSTVAETRFVGLNNWTIKFTVLILFIFVMSVIFNRTKIGRFSQSYGESKVVPGLSGINIDRYRMYAYLIGGVSVGLAGYFLLCRLGTMSTITGLNEEMNVIIALALGGMVMSGGMKTSVRCGVVGGLIVAILINGMVIIGVPHTITEGIKGIVFLIVVSISFVRDRNVKLLPR
jgi:ribose transport system permease protein